ncbi:cell agglutination protein Mam3 [Rhodotorula sphaerocarpa]
MPQPIWRVPRTAGVLQLAVLLPRLLRTYAAPTAAAAVMIGTNSFGDGNAAMQGNEPETPPGSTAFWWKLGLSAGLVLLGGVFAGLTLGLMGLDLVNLQVLSTSGDEQEQKDASKVMRLLERGRHWVLVVLLLSNVVVNESLPIFLDSILGGGLGAVILSTTLIVIFGEIIPQSICARHGLRIGAFAAPFVLALMYIEFPIAYPIAKLLDRLLGEEQGVTYKKAELKTFVGLHRQFGEETLNDDEVTIISSVLELGDKNVADIMTPLEDIYSLPVDTKLSQRVVDQILASGHSRIPIHAQGDTTDFVGMLIVKKLISYDPEDERQIGDFSLSVLPETGPDSTCLDVLNYFQQGRSHILLVSETPGEPGGALGVVSLEDVIEEMIGEEIIDETDLYIDIHAKTRVVRAQNRKTTKEGKLGPLIAGESRVIERRRQARRANTADLPPNAGNGARGGNSNGTNTASSSNTTIARSSTPVMPPLQHHVTSGFDKVRVRGGGLPERRVPSGANTPVPNGSRALSPARRAQVQSATAAAARSEGERAPLLKKQQQEANSKKP